MNSELYNKTYKLPSDVLKHLQTTLVSIPQGEGVKRAKFLLKNGVVTYQDLKRIKHDIENTIKRGSPQYQLAGGDLMKAFVDQTLNRERSAVKREKEIKKDINIDPNLGTKAQQTPQLNENDAVSDAVGDAENDALKKNALAVIINDDNQILLLRRNPNIEMWQPGRWALVGGGVEEGETPEEAVKREIKEETGLNINKFKEKFTIQRNPDSIEHIFIAKYDGNPEDINLNWEHVCYGWYSPDELYFLNHVPNLVDYINIAFKKYD